jgi:hypothetical protein
MPDSDYEFIEVKVSHKIDIKLSLDDLVTMLQQASQSVGPSSPGALADKLNQLNQVAQQVKAQLPGR